MNSERNNAGFTLIEILVALTIIVAILAMVYGSYAATTRSIETSTNHMASVERACLVLRLMARQIRCAYAPLSDASPPEPSSPSPGPREAARTAGSPHYAAGTLTERPAELFQADSHNPRGEILSFITSGGPGARPDGSCGLSHVAYQYDKATWTLSIARQDCADLQLKRMNSAKSNPLLHNVTSIEMRLYDGRQWQDDWDFSRKQQLPHAVNIEIVVADETGSHHQVGTIIPIMQHPSAERKSGKRVVAIEQP